LLLDEMWPSDIAVQLRSRGHDVDAVVERTDLRGVEDHEIFDAAQSEGRAIVTEDADYRVLFAGAVRSGGTCFGVIFTSDRAFPRDSSRTAGRLVTALDRLLNTDTDLTNREHWLSSQ
jgi:hypothetical protein